MKKSEANIEDLRNQTVSWGTHRPDDLIPKFMAVLKEYGKEAYDKYVSENPEVVDWKMLDDETKGWVVDELFDLLDGIAPEDCYFGAHPGDGADFGFWQVDESKKKESLYGRPDSEKDELAGKYYVDIENDSEGTIYSSKQEFDDYASAEEWANSELEKNADDEDVFQASIYKMFVDTDTDQLDSDLEGTILKSDVCESKKNEAKYDGPVTLYGSTRYDDAEEAQKFLDGISGGQVKVSKDRNGDMLIVSIAGSDEDIDAFLEVYKDNYDNFETDCDANVMGWTSPGDLPYLTVQGRKELTGESKKSEGLADGDAALLKMQKSLKQYADKTTGEIAADIRYDVATALDMPADEVDDVMQNFGLDNIYILRSKGLSPKAIAQKILKSTKSKKSEGGDDDKGCKGTDCKDDMAKKNEADAPFKVGDFVSYEAGKDGKDPYASYVYCEVIGINDDGTLDLCPYGTDAETDGIGDNANPAYCEKLDHFAGMVDANHYYMDGKYNAYKGGWEILITNKELNPKVYEFIGTIDDLSEVIDIDDYYGGENFVFDEDLKDEVENNTGWDVETTTFADMTGDVGESKQTAVKKSEARPTKQDAQIKELCTLCRNDKNVADSVFKALTKDYNTSLDPVLAGQYLTTKWKSKLEELGGCNCWYDGFKKLYAAMGSDFVCSVLQDLKLGSSGIGCGACITIVSNIYDNVVKRNETKKSESSQDWIAFYFCVDNRGDECAVYPHAVADREGNKVVSLQSLHSPLGEHDAYKKDYILDVMKPIPMEDIEKSAIYKKVSDGEDREIIAIDKKDAERIMNASNPLSELNKVVQEYDSYKGEGLANVKKSESLTLKQKELKDLVRLGEAEDITAISDAEAKELKKKGVETIGVSRGIYGMNGALLRDYDGKKYAILARNGNLFYFV